ERGGDREAAGVGERVEHAPAARQPADAQAVVALVEEEAGLLPVQDVGHEAHAVLHDRDPRRRLLAREHPTCAGESLLGAHATLAALVDTARREARLERGDDVAGDPHATPPPQLAAPAVTLP